MRYSVQTRTTAGGHAVVTLLDDLTGARASVLPAVGFNLFDLRLPLAGQVRSIIATEPGWENHPQRPTRQGIPVLFPFPNRIRDGCFSWSGQAFTLPRNKPPHAIHGFAVEAPWGDVVPVADASGASVSARFWLGRDAPAHRGHWPEDAVLLLRYDLVDGSLRLEADISNPGRTTLPWGLGLHAYFHLPFDEQGDPARTRVVIPARSFWELDEAMPTGQIRAVDPDHDFRAGRPRKRLQADDLLTNLTTDPDGWSTCRLVDENLCAEVRLRSDPGTRHIVVFTPPTDDRVVAIEPYTQATDAINLATRGIDAGLNRLDPGRTTKLRFAIETCAL